MIYVTDDGIRGMGMESRVVGLDRGKGIRDLGARPRLANRLGWLAGWTRSGPLALLHLVAGEGTSRAVVGRHDLLVGRVVGADLGDTRRLVGLEGEQAAARARRG